MKKVIVIVFSFILFTSCIYKSDNSFLLIPEDNLYLNNDSLELRIVGTHIANNKIVLLDIDVIIYNSTKNELYKIKDFNDIKTIIHNKDIVNYFLEYSIRLIDNEDNLWILHSGQFYKEHFNSSKTDSISKYKNLFLDKIQRNEFKSINLQSNYSIDKNIKNFEMELIILEKKYIFKNFEKIKPNQKSIDANKSKTLFLQIVLFPFTIFELLFL